MSTKRRKPIKQAESKPACEVIVLRDQLLALLKDVEDLFSLDLAREKRVVMKRVASEGIGFLAGVLPDYFRWVLDSLRQERLHTQVPRMKITRKYGAARPAFLSGLTNMLFNAAGEYIKPVSAEAKYNQAEVLKSINFITESFGKKYELPLSAREHDAQLKDIFELDQLVYDPWDDIDSWSDEKQQLFVRARSLLVRAFEDFKTQSVNARSGKYETVVRTFWDQTFKPSFGPGAVYERYASYDKYRRFTCPPPQATLRLDLADSFVPSPATRSEGSICTFPEGSADDFRRLLRGGCARAAIVPKKWRVGRIVMLMQNEFMFFQQGFKDMVYSWIERHPLTRGQVNFEDQTINGAWALEGSRTGDWSTIDLKRASDSVSRGHVVALFDPDVAEMLLLLRPHSIEAKLMDGSVLSSNNIRMYAPMGSALCFPVEALVFWSICKSALEIKGNWSNVYVYGDDIIVPTQEVDTVKHALEIAGFTVNSDKTFSTGPFRESCGEYALNGLSARVPFRIKKRVPSAGIGLSPGDRNKCAVAWVEYANLAEQAGYPTLSRSLRETCYQYFPKSKAFPLVREISETNCAYLAFLDYGEGKHPHVPIKKPNCSAITYRIAAPPSMIYEPFLRGRTHLWGCQKLFDFKADYHAKSVSRYCNRSESVELNESAFPPILQYLRWVLEKPEDTLKFPHRDEFHIGRHRVHLT